jgi:hypothetical protein
LPLEFNSRWRDDAPHDPALLDHQQRRNGLDPEALRQIGTLLDVHTHDFKDPMISAQPEDIR